MDPRADIVLNLLILCISSVNVVVSLFLVQEYLGDIVQMFGEVPF